MCQRQAEDYLVQENLADVRIVRDFICKHMRSYKEAPAHVRRCHNCNMWKKSDGIPGNFWCKHNKPFKKEWDRKQG